MGSISPFSIRVFPQAVPDRVDLLPALPPFVCVPLLCAHVHDFQIVPPSSCILLLVSYTVALYRPFSWSFPLHHTSSLIRCQNDHELLTTAEELRSAPQM